MHPTFDNNSVLDRVVDNQKDTLRTRALNGNEYYLEITPTFGENEPSVLEYEIYGKPIYRQVLFDYNKVRDVFPEKNIYYLGAKSMYYAYIREDYGYAKIASYLLDGKTFDEAMSFDSAFNRVKIDAQKLEPGSRHTLTLKYIDYAGKEITCKYSLQIYNEPTMVKVNGKPSGTTFKQLPLSAAEYKISSDKNVDLSRIECDQKTAVYFFGYGGIKVDVPHKAMTVTFMDKETGNELGKFTFEPDENALKKIVPSVKLNKANTNEKQLVFDAKVTIPKSLYYVSDLKLQIKGKRTKGGDQYKSEIDELIDVYPGPNTVICNISDKDITDLTELAEYEVTTRLVQDRGVDGLLECNPLKTFKVQNKLTYINDKLTLSKSKLTLNAYGEATVKVKINDKATDRKIDVISMDSDNEKYVYAENEDGSDIISISAGYSRTDYTAKYIVKCGGASSVLEVTLKADNSEYSVSAAKSAYYKPVGKALKIPMTVYEKNSRTGKEKKVSANNFYFKLYGGEDCGVTIDKKGVITVPKYAFGAYYSVLNIWVDVYSSHGACLNSCSVRIYFDKLTPYEIDAFGSGDGSGELVDEVSIFACQDRVVVYDNLGWDFSYDDAKYVNRYTYSSTGALKLNKKGEVISIKPGKATITAKATDGTKVSIKRTVQIYGDAYNDDEPDGNVCILPARDFEKWRLVSLVPGTKNVYDAYEGEKLLIHGFKGMKMSIEGAKDVSVVGENIYFVPDKTEEIITVKGYDYYGNIKEYTYNVTFNILKDISEFELVYRSRKNVYTPKGEYINYKWEIKNIEGLEVYKKYYLHTEVAPEKEYDSQRTALENYMKDNFWTPSAGYMFSADWENGKLILNMMLSESVAKYEMGTAKVHFYLSEYDSNKEVGIKRDFIFDPTAVVKRIELPEISLPNAVVLDKTAIPVSLFDVHDELGYDMEIAGTLVNGAYANQDLADALSEMLDINDSDPEHEFYFFNMANIPDAIYDSYKGKTVELVLNVTVMDTEADEDSYKIFTKKVKFTIK